MRGAVTPLFIYFIKEGLMNVYATTANTVGVELEVHHATTELLNSPLVFIRVLVDFVMHHVKENDASALSTYVHMSLRCPNCLNAT